MKKRKYYIPDPHYVASIGWQNYLEEFGDYYAFGYINSYKEAGDILVEAMCPDLFVFPIIFCYRQYLELLLKNIYFIKKKDEYNSFINKVSHNLIKIWEFTTPILQAEIKEKEIKFIEKVVIFFDKLDPNSFTFRYEYNKRNERNIKKTLCIDTLGLKKRISKVDCILRYSYDEF